MKAICFANHKGGCAKTTVTLNVAVALAKAGFHVLAVDLDPQGNLSSALGADLEDLASSHRTAYRLMLDEKQDYTHYLVQARPRLDLVPNCLDDEGETLVENAPVARELMLRERLEAAQPNYDFCVIDTPPRLKAPTLNGLALADLTIVPVDSSSFALIGLRELLGKIGRIRRTHQPNQMVMALLSIFTQRQILDRQVREQVIARFTDDFVFRTTIPRAVNVGESTSLQQAVVENEPESNAGFAFLQLVQEIREVLNVEKQAETAERITG